MDKSSAIHELQGAGRELIRAVKDVRFGEKFAALRSITRAEAAVNRARAAIYQRGGEPDETDET